MGLGGSSLHNAEQQKNDVMTGAWDAFNKGTKEEAVADKKTDLEVTATKEIVLANAQKNADIARDSIESMLGEIAKNKEKFNIGNVLPPTHAP